MDSRHAPIKVEAAVDAEEALGYLGYAGQAIDEPLLRRFEDMAKACEESSVPAGAMRRFAIDREKSDFAGASGDSFVAFEGCPFVLEGASIAGHLRDCTEVVLFACTLGLRNEQEARRRKALNAVDGLLFGSCGSSLVESAAEALDRSVREEARSRGLATTWRFSPGYGDMPLAVQRPFLAVLEAPKLLGMSVTPDNFLIPTKSVTAVIGLFDPSACGGEYAYDERYRCEPAARCACREGAGGPGSSDGSGVSGNPGGPVDPDRSQPADGSSAAGDSIDPRCAACRLLQTCTFRQQGRTCHGK